MIKKSRLPKHLPGDLERFTALIERKAKEIAQVLLWDVADAEQTVESKNRGTLSAKRTQNRGRISSTRPNKNRDLQREQRISRAKQGGSRRP